MTEEPTVNWIKLSRQLFFHDLASEKPWCRGFAWAYLIALAAHDHFIPSSHGREVILERGQLVITMEDFCAQTGWSRSKAIRFFAYLVRNNMVTMVSNRHLFTVVTILNYDKWQGAGQPTGQRIGQPTIQKNASPVKHDEPVPGQQTIQRIGQPTGQPHEEDSSQTLFKEGTAQEGCTRKKIEKTTPARPKISKMPSLRFDPTTLSIIASDNAQEFFANAFPQAVYSVCLEDMRAWIIGKNPGYQNYWKTLCKFAQHFDRDHPEMKRLFVTCDDGRVTEIVNTTKPRGPRTKPVMDPEIMAILKEKTNG